MCRFALISRLRMLNFTAFQYTLRFALALSITLYGIFDIRQPKKKQRLISDIELIVTGISLFNFSEENAYKL